MYKSGSEIKLSASDLSQFMGCRHATWLDLSQVNGEIQPPKQFYDASLDALIKKGEEFEQRQLELLQQQGKTIVVINKENNRQAAADTLAAMKSGADVIYQARFEQGVWNGWADFLVKTDKASKLGNWSYEVEDTKFAKHTKAGAILQISLYSQMLAAIQGVQPQLMYIRTPAGLQSFRVNDYKAYFNLVQRKLLQTVANPLGDTYPDPVPQCDVCRWWLTCNTRRRDDDHLTFVAGMGTAQVREVRSWGVNTLKHMAELPSPVPFKPARGSVDTFNKLREQARLQHESRVQKKYLHELLPVQDEIGLCRLPEPDEGDMFFDFEGDPFVGESGREYLFGWIYKNEYSALWATTDEEELQGFEKYLDEVKKIRQQHPGMHIYHFSQYEPTALKRLMGKYGTRENEVDSLLRANVFVDLHTVTKHSLRAGIESYSLKELEKLHKFTRTRDLRLVGHHKALLETMLESGVMDAVDEETRMIVQDYNREDCESTQSLRDWLEELRAQQIKKGRTIKRPAPGDENASEQIEELQERIKPIYEALMRDLPFEKAERTAEQQSRWLLANMLDWYRREDKAFWWNYYRLRELPDEDLLEERDAIAGLVFTNNAETVSKSQVHYYTFPEQDGDLKRGAKVDYKGAKVGEIHSIDLNRRIVGIKKTKKTIEVHPTHIICSDHVEDKIKRDAIIRLASWVVDNGVDAAGDYRAGRDLLMNHLPRTTGSIKHTMAAQEKAVEWVMHLDHGVLPVQGPPGTGKSYTAARMIIALVKAGKKIGVTALSHKVITALLQKVYDLANDEKLSINIIQKVGEIYRHSDPRWVEAMANSDVADALHTNGAVHVIGGTSFMWAREEFFQSVDVMFVDEAGQLSLIDTLALSHAGTSLVLLGDPQQLQQPQQGSHPEGTEVSALQHVLGDHGTIPEEKGVFLDKTWRLHPAICEYISELFYESRLLPMPLNANQRLVGSTQYPTPGIYIERVIHAGNSNVSQEEVDVVAIIIRHLLEGGLEVVDARNNKRPVTADCIKVISPYNAQVNALSAALPGIQVGTVDKFQGQEAHVIIFSMATSTPDDAPRGMEFLYSLNRLNVAVSRARTVFVLVASPALFEPGCQSPRQMRLANALCRLVEVANR
jgi:predicted RecB family nuclease